MRAERGHSVLRNVPALVTRALESKLGQAPAVNTANRLDTVVEDPVSFTPDLERLAASACDA
jgi:hypothetical protein